MLFSGPIWHGPVQEEMRRPNPLAHKKRVQACVAQQVYPARESQQIATD